MNFCKLQHAEEYKWSIHCSDHNAQNPKKIQKGIWPTAPKNMYKDTETTKNNVFHVKFEIHGKDKKK